MASWGVPYSKFTEEEKTCACFIDGSALHAGTIQKWTAAAPQPLPGISLKDSSEGKSFQWAKLQATHLVAHFAWKEKWSEVCLYCDSCVMANGLAGWAQTWKYHEWKINDKEVGRRGIWIDVSEWARKQRYLCPMWMLTKEWPQQRRTLIIK